MYAAMYINMKQTTNKGENMTFNELMDAIAIGCLFVIIGLLLLAA